ncbi:hypothetical protein SSX86_025164 [Deinandra increscens subsp. villosa]|uniref:TF-B3 domain-containing protein n=1 Tax=Deinandra increscens subsp. villosa TaxID=3103831 RepID=A0AAP0GMP8_9ASTR
MAAPVTEQFNLAVSRSDLHLTKTDLKTPDSAENDLTSAQLANTSNAQPHASSLRKHRRKSKPIRCEPSETNVQIEHTPPNISIVPRDPSGPHLSLQKEKSPTEGFKTPVPSSPTMLRAMEVQYSLGTEFPSCIKTMCRSQVNSGFWLGLPLQFCKSFLPKEDTTVVLEDENGEQCEVKYIAYKYGISGGWKNFANRHNLIEEDVLVFHLVRPTKFKVYILKAVDSSEAGHALSLLNLEAHTEGTSTVALISGRKKNKHPVSLSLSELQKKHKKSAPSSRSILLSDPRNKHSRNTSEEGCSEVRECSRQSNHSLQEFKSFQDFRIVVNGLCIDRELPRDVRLDYYKLCFYKKEFLHDGLPAGLYSKLAAGMIGETVSIANEIKSCEITTTKEEFETWDKSLKSFELLGMKVGFLRDKINTLATLVFESEGALDIKRYAEANNKQKHAEDEIKKVAAKLKELKETAKKFDGIAGCLKQKVEMYEHMFREEVAALW